MWISGTNGWGNRYAFLRQPIHRAQGVAVEARVEPSNTSMWGLKDTTTNYSYTQMPYATYFYADNNIYIYESGSQQGGSYGSYTPGQPYDVRIVLKQPAGATYFIRPAGASAWTQLYDSANGAMADMLVGVTVYKGHDVDVEVVERGRDGPGQSPDRDRQLELGPGVRLLQAGDQAGERAGV
jgi:hypothetical protein